MSVTKRGRGPRRKLLSGTLLSSVLASMLVFGTTGIAAANSLTIQVNRVSDGVAPFEDWRAADTNTPTGSPTVTQAADDANGDGLDADPGDDVSAYDSVGPNGVGVVRTIDKVRWRVAYSLSKNVGDDNTASGVFVYVDVPNGFVVDATTLPPSGTSSACPNGTNINNITAAMNPDPLMVGGQRVNCLFPASFDISSSVSRFFEFESVVAATLPNGVGIAGAAEYAPTVRMGDSEGTPTVTRTRTDHPSAAVIVSAAPRYDLVKSATGNFATNDAWAATVVNGALYFRMTWPINLRAGDPDRRGLSMLGTGLSFQDVYENVTGGMGAIPYSFVSCGPSGSGFSNLTCAQPGGAGTPINVSFDMSNWSLYLANLNSAYPGQVTQITVDVPFAYVDTQDGNATNNLGSIRVRNHVGDGFNGSTQFDPKDLTGVSNYLTGQEPRPLVTTSAQVDGHQNTYDKTFTLTAPGVGALNKVGQGVGTPIAGDVNIPADLTLVDGQPFVTSLQVKVNNNFAPAGTIMCDKWDNARTGLRGDTEAKFIQRADPVSITGTLPYVIEYGKSDTWGKGVPDSSDPHVWWVQNNTTCGDTDPADLGGGTRWVSGAQVDWTDAGLGVINADDLNMVRVRWIAPTEPGISYNFWLYWVAKDIDEKLWHLNSSAGYSTTYTTANKWIVPAPPGCNTVAQTCPVAPSGVPLNPDGYVNISAAGVPTSPWIVASGVPAAFAWQHVDPELQVDHCSYVTGNSVCTATSNVTPGQNHEFRLRLSACIGSLRATIGEANIAPMTADNHRGGSCYTTIGGRYDLVMQATLLDPYDLPIPNVELVDILPPGFLPVSASLPWKTVNGLTNWTAADGCPATGCEIVWDVGTIPAAGFSPRVDLTVFIPITTPYGTYANRARGRYADFDQPGAWVPQNVQVSPSGSGLVSKAAGSGTVLEGSPATFSVIVRNDSGNTWDTADTVDILPYNGDTRGTSLSGALVLQGATATAAVKAKTDVFVSGTAPATLDALDAPTGPPYSGVPPAVTYPAPIFSATDRLLDPRFNRTANALGGVNWPCKVDWSSATFAIIPVAPATTCPALDAITAVRFVGYDNGKPIGAQNLPATDGNTATGYLLAGEIATVSLEFGTQNLEPTDKMVNTVRASFGNGYNGGTAESDAPPLPADFNAGTTITIYNGVIGSILFADTNANGKQDGTEDGIANVTLELLDGAGNPAVDADGDPIANVTTNADGQYAFIGLKPGDYIVRVLAAELSGTGDLAGYRVSPTAGAPNGDLDQDMDQNLLAGFQTGTITLTLGGEPLGEPDAAALVPAGTRDSDTNLTLDLGVVPPMILTLSKTASVSQIHSGDSVTYTFTLTASGTSAHSVVLTDSDTGCSPTLSSGDTNTNSILETTETWKYTCTLTNVTDALDATSNTDHTNTADVTGLDILDVEVKHSDDATVDIIGSTLTVEKSPSKTSVRTGTTVTYTFEVTASGDPVSNVTISDTDADCNSTMSTPAGDGDDDSILDLGETWTYTCEVDVTDALDGTSNTDHTNTVTVEGEDPLGAAVSDTDEVTIDIVVSTINVVKAASASTIHEGDTVTYTFTVTATGDPVHDVTISDTDTDCGTSLSAVTGDTNSDSILQSTETWKYTCDVAVTDALDGDTSTDHSNTVTADGKDPSDGAVQDTDEATVDIVASTIAVTKVADPTSIHEGDTVTYTFEVTVTGDPVSDVALSDTDTACNNSLSGPTGDDGDSILQSTETWKYTCDVDVTDALDGDSNTDHENTVTATGTDPANGDVEATATETVDIVASQIGVTKTASATSIHEGDTVTYTFEITNVGDPLTSVTLDDTDTACDSSLSGPTGDTNTDSILQAGETWKYTCDVVVTDALDGDTNTDHTNTVTASGKDPAGVKSSADAKETVDIVDSTVAITKTPSTTTIHEGDTVTYTFEVTGTGDPQHSVVVSDTDSTCNDSMAGPTGDTDTDGLLDEGEVWKYTCDVAVTDALDGTALTDHTNTVTVTALDPLDHEASGEDEVTVDIVGSTLNVVKTADPTEIHSGDSVTYTFEVSTVGDPISNVVLTDTDNACNATMTTPTGDDGDSVLQAGETWTYSCSVVVTDVLDGTTNTDHTNTATVTGTDPLDLEVESTDGALVDIIRSDVSITKSPSAPAIHSGDTVTYTFVVTVVGDPVAEPNINDSDDQCNAAMSGPTGDAGDLGVLEAGETWTYTCSIAVTDALDGTAETDHTNDVSFTGTDPLGLEVTDEDSATVDIVGSDLSLRKSAVPAAIMTGESVTYTFTLTVTGDPVSSPAVTDPQCVISALTGDSNNNTKLDEGETWTGTCTVPNVTDSTDGATNTMHVNAATATGTDPLGAPLTGSANAEVRFLGSIGDYVWTDVNHDGQQSADEPAVGGLKVELYECATGDSTSCVLLRTTTTAVNGHYLFDRLPEGRYQLKFIPIDGMVPTGMATGAATTDSDIASDGRTLVISLKAGERNATIDAGYTSAFNLMVTKSVQGGTTQVALSPGQQVTFEILVANDGLGAVPAEVHMNDPLPAGMTYVSHTAPAGWTCSVLNNTLSCIEPRMDAGEKASFAITVVLDSTPRGGELKNVANVTTIGVEGKTTDNEHSANIEVQGVDAGIVPPAQPQTPTPNPLPAADRARAALAVTGRDLWEETLLALGLLALGSAASITSQRRRRKLRLPTEWA